MKRKIIIAFLAIILCVSCFVGLTACDKKHRHTVVIDAAVPATCTTDGAMISSYCSDCGKIFVAQVIIPATGHTFEQGKTVEHTCTVDGFTVYTCSKCGETYKDDIVDAHHVWDIEEPTCFRSQICTVCGEEGLPATGDHEYDDDMICTICGNHIYDLCEHEFTDTVYDPTCTEEGYTVSVCDICGKTETHDFVDAEGHSDGVFCSKCGEFLIPSEIFANGIKTFLDQDFTLVIKNVAMGVNTEDTILSFAELKLGFDENNNLYGMGYCSVADPSEDNSDTSAIAVIKDNVLYAIVDNATIVEELDDEMYSLAMTASMYKFVAVYPLDMLSLLNASDDEPVYSYPADISVLDYLSAAVSLYRTSIAPAIESFIEMNSTSIGNVISKALVALFDITETEDGYRFVLSNSKVELLLESLNTTTLKQFFFGDCDCGVEELIATVNGMFDSKISDTINTFDSLGVDFIDALNFVDAIVSENEDLKNGFDAIFKGLDLGDLAALLENPASLNFTLTQIICAASSMTAEDVDAIKQGVIAFINQSLALTPVQAVYSVLTALDVEIGTQEEFAYLINSTVLSFLEIFEGGFAIDEEGALVMIDFKVKGLPVADIFSELSALYFDAEIIADYELIGNYDALLEEAFSILHPVTITNELVESILKGFGFETDEIEYTYEVEKDENDVAIALVIETISVVSSAPAVGIENTIEYDCSFAEICIDLTRFSLLASPDCENWYNCKFTYWADISSGVFDRLVTYGEEGEIIDSYVGKRKVFMSTTYPATIIYLLNTETAEIDFVETKHDFVLDEELSDIPEKCGVVGHATYFCSVCNASIVTLFSYSHSNVIVEYEFLNEADVNNCEDGVTIRKICTVCEKVIEEKTYYSHEAIESFSFDFRNEGGELIADVCEDHVLTFYACPCGMNSYCYIDDEYILYSYSCDDCGLEITFDSFVDYLGDCVYERTNVTVLAIDGETFETIEKSYQFVYHNDETFVSLADEDSTSCEDGVIVTKVCEDCGYTVSYTTYEHVTGVIVLLDLEELDYDGYFYVYGCACGEHSYSDRLNFENLYEQEVESDDPDEMIFDYYSFDDVLVARIVYTKVSVDEENCEVRSNFVIYVGYNAETGEYLKVGNGSRITGYEHTYGEGTPDEYITCQLNYYCEVCGLYGYSEMLHTDLEESSEVFCEATCTQNGYSHYSIVCWDCGYSDEGFITTYAFGHEYEYDEEKDIYACKNCDYETSNVVNEIHFENLTAEESDNIDIGYISTYPSSDFVAYLSVTTNEGDVLPATGISVKIVSEIIAIDTINGVNFTRDYFSFSKQAVLDFCEQNEIEATAVILNVSIESTVLSFTVAL